MLAHDLDLRHPLIWTVSDVLDEAACTGLIARIEEMGPTEAPITTAAGFVMRPDIRNNTRVIFDDQALADDLFARVRGHLPAEMKGMAIAGVNERFRCYRYTPGQRFAAHYDGAFIRDAAERSWLTFMVYLNDGFVGGATDFPANRRTIAPRRGTALLFQHALLHEGAEVLSGVKYVLRSDIMYRQSD